MLRPLCSSPYPLSARFALKFQFPATAAMYGETKGIEFLGGVTLNSTNQHAVAVAVKAVPGLDRVPIGVQHVFPPCKSADKGKQRGPRKMEVCQQRIYCAKFKSRSDKEASFRSAGSEQFRNSRLGRAQSGIFQRANHSCSYRKNFSSLRSCRSDFLDRFFGISYDSACITWSFKSSA